MLLFAFTIFIYPLALVAAQSGMSSGLSSSSSSSSMGYGPFGNASMTPNGNICGECNIFFFPYLRVWNESSSDGTYENATVATAYVYINEATNMTTTSITSVATISKPPSCTGDFLCPFFEPGSPPSSTYILSAGPSGINITTVVVSPTALIYWGAYSLQGAYPTTNTAGSTFCNSTTIGKSFVIVPFTGVTTYPFLDIPAPYTGTVPVPSLSFEDIPFPTANAQAFLAQFPNMNAFSYCTPLRYYGAPEYASPVMSLTQTSIIRQAAVTTTLYSPTTTTASTIVRPTTVPQTSTLVASTPPPSSAASSQLVSTQATPPPPAGSSQPVSTEALPPPPTASSSAEAITAGVSTSTPGASSSTDAGPSSEAGVTPSSPAILGGTTTTTTTVSILPPTESVSSGISSEPSSSGTASESVSSTAVPPNSTPTVTPFRGASSRPKSIGASWLAVCGMIMIFWS